MTHPRLDHELGHQDEVDTMIAMARLNGHHEVRLKAGGFLLYCGICGEAERVTCMQNLGDSSTDRGFLTKQACVGRRRTFVGANR